MWSPGRSPAPGLCPAAPSCADDVALLAVARADAAGVVAVAEVRQLDVRQRDGDRCLPSLPISSPLVMNLRRSC